MRHLVIFLGLLTTMSACRHAILGEDNARRALARALAGTEDNFQTRQFELIPDKETATKFAEVILFKTFGEEKVKDERPYEIYKIDGYWVMSGTIPIGYDGGGFEIIFQSMDGKIISLKHYR
jgi:hypothetical protein